MTNSYRNQVLFLFTLCVLAAISIIWMRIITVKNTYLYVQNQNELKQLQQEVQAERVQWLRLTAPKKLESLAKLLGLVPPKVTQVTRLRAQTKNSQSKDTH